MRKRTMQFGALVVACALLMGAAACELLTITNVLDASQKGGSGGAGQGVSGPCDAITASVIVEFTGPFFSGGKAAVGEPVGVSIRPVDVSGRDLPDICKRDEPSLTALTSNCQVLGSPSFQAASVLPITAGICAVRGCYQGRCGSTQVDVIDK